MNTYWTIQRKNVWEQAKVIGCLTGSSEHIWPEFEVAYQWMIEQMSKRLNCLPSAPVWVWVDRPDMRSKNQLGIKGVETVLLEVKLNPDLVLLSDFVSWHYVLNNFTVEFYDNEPIDKMLSWERIFDIETLCSLQDYGDCILQGVTPTIHIEQLKCIKEFIAK
ncbi:DUF3841 domain-containing protein [Cytophagaceae bacterium DM2B3-1]|uniref:DUF3841 domain-containing protein n=1 Tax=Xanthocytophaga flava TaxID=3048013 RepID=A0ABT7CV80_9BACT|nr:DUF3841 domain-containing protein [Xanthocytophaga flavus]MDJ1497657.1 DUF3841 domain-containing protein [Xanthocytophaga flavus]